MSECGERTGSGKIEARDSERPSGQVGLFFDQTRCTGCYACTVACKDWNDVPPGPASWMRVSTIEKGRFPDPFLAFLPQSCYHCLKAPCAAACPAEAITKREEDGIVIVDREKCLGQEQCGGMCLIACPYDAPQFGAEENPRMQKCDFCLDEWTQGRKPVCVRSCPMRALDAGPMEQIRAVYGDVREAEGFSFQERSEPAAFFKPKQGPSD